MGIGVGKHEHFEKWFYKLMAFELDAVFLKVWSLSDPLRYLKMPDLLNQNPQKWVPGFFLKMPSKPCTLKYTHKVKQIWVPRHESKIKKKHGQFNFTGSGGGEEE